MKIIKNTLLGLFVLFICIGFSQNIDAKTVNKVEYQNGAKVTSKYYYDSKNILYKKVVYKTNKKKQLKSTKHGKAYRYIYTYQDKKYRTMVRHTYKSNGKVTNSGAKFYTYYKGKRHPFVMASKSYSLSSKYNPGRNKTTQSAYNKMIAAAKKDGVYFRMLSWYRSYATQKATFNYWVKVDGLKKAEMYSARPGKSEHQTGRAIDFGSTTNKKTDFEPSFANTKEGKWLANNAHKYGFTQSYKNGKTKITGYIPESWHYYHISNNQANAVFHATNMKNQNKVKEEYFGLK